MSRVTPSDSGPSSLCLFCKHWDVPQPLRRIWVCSAFPRGIPDEIGYGDFNHRKPHPEDNGIQFELVEGSTLPDWVEEFYPSIDVDI
jgi:hypothetical protein